MHIPDGYLSPQTYVPLCGVTLAALAVAVKKVRENLSSRQVPFIAMAAAFSFLIQMFNIPIPGGTTGHAVGGAIIAILLGPWTGVLAISLVLIIQAVVFGDGGITTIGANCFNMAILMPFTSSWVFRLVRGRARDGRRLKVAAFLAGYIGLFVAACATAVEFGIQPLIASDASGRPLYAPYPLSVAVPVMAIEHLALFGIVEGIMTLLLLNHFVTHEPAMLFAADREDGVSFRKRLWIGLAILALLAPIGILLPEWMGAKGAWGEWSSGELGRMLGFVPEGMRALADGWSAPIPGYSFGGDSESLVGRAIAYAVSGFMGIAMLVAIAYGVLRTLAGCGRASAESDMRGGGTVNFSYVDRGLAKVAEVIKTTWLQWETASGSGFFQRLDSRVKLLFLFVFAITVNLKRGLPAQLSVTLFVVALSVATLPSFVQFWRRIFLLALIFGFLIAMPATLNLFVAGDVVMPLVTLPRAFSFWVYRIPAVIGLTDRGIESCALLTLRVANSVSLSLLVIETTPFPEIVRGLKMFRVPDVFLLMLTLSYKYIFIFARTVEEMHLARKSRLIVPSQAADAGRWVAGSMASLYRKTQHRCEEVYKAMTARGFSEKVALEAGGGLRAADWLAAAGFVAIAAAVTILM